MFLNSWSLSLTLCSLLVLFLGGLAVLTAIRVLRYWNPASDSNRQIRLENEIWLTSTLVEYGLGFQIITLVIFILAADHYCQMIVGAMCATGALLANSYGMPALFVKIGGVFFYGFWIVLHKLDISSESYPLVRIKYIYLLLLIPLLLTDIILQTMYIAGLKPDIITSCCAVVFSVAEGDGRNMLGSIPQSISLILFYFTMVVLTGLGFFLLRKWHWLTAFLSGFVWLWFLGLAVVVTTSVISSYVYAMPFHHCPFCILKPEYYYIGFGIYGTLIPAVFFGLAAPMTGIIAKNKELTGAIKKFRHFAIRLSLWLLLAFALFSSYHYLIYQITGGES
ncbi:MAG: hypothetical protein KKB30_08035 [Proteobacteria bacterium]|nr:hypothetical protein [Pseudomonadota bacterium]MBU1714768.1 hypothetical protein [Pseudomonadota bacterium]